MKVLSLSFIIFFTLMLNSQADESTWNDGQSIRANTTNSDARSIGSLVIDPNRISTLSDGGWSSSGGGEFLINKNNPWFLGGKEVSWCINHGGPSNFSLPLVESKKIIQEVLDSFSHQIKNLIDPRLITQQGGNFINCPVNSYSPDSINSKSGKMICEGDLLKYHDFSDPMSMHYIPSAVYDPIAASSSNKGKFLSHHFIYNRDCRDVDLEIILGNVSDPKIKKLRNSYGDFRFKLVAGTAIRTSYNEFKKRGKGFIYMASDKGAMKYAGYSKFQNIWNPNLASNLDQGPFASVFAHELGHVFGFKHNSKGNLMDEDFPAKTIAEGKIENEVFDYQTRIFSNSLIPITKKPIYIGYRLKPNGPAYHGVDSWPKVIWGTGPLKQLRGYDKVISFYFNAQKILTNGNMKQHYDYSKKSKFRVSTYDEINKTYTEDNEFEIVNFEVCDPSSVISLEKVSLRANFKDVSNSGKYVQSLPLIDFWKKEICGKILIPGKGEIGFRLVHDYFNIETKLKIEQSSMINLGPHVYSENEYGLPAVDPFQ